MLAARRIETAFLYSSFAFLFFFLTHIHPTFFLMLVGNGLKSCVEVASASNSAQNWAL